jgi:rare lipoprotein A
MLRVRFAGDGVIGGAQAAVGRVAVLRRALASWYGPGFYGHPVACGGGPLGPDQIGVAHRTLPCGTRLTLRYRGRTVQATVIDRGPFMGGREFDLTGATARALGFGGVGMIEVAVD